MDLRDGTWTIMFTDLVGSTEQRARLGDGPADRLRREHDTIVARNASRHHGTVVKSTGDGSLLAFSGASDAVAAAVAIQAALARRNRTADEPIAVRIGVSLGDVGVEDGDLFGTAVVEAARVCALAGDGEILVTDVVRLVAGSRVPAPLSARGAADLKGLPDPVTLWSVEWTPDLAAGAALPLPGLLAADGEFALAGRTAELAVLGEAWARAAAGARQAVLLSGEPGIGKTRLASEIARTAHHAGAAVLFGRCDDAVAVPYQPFAEALDWFADHADLGAHPELLGTFPGDLARVSRRLERVVAELPRPLEADADEEQRRLFDAVSSWLGAMCETQPVVLVLDDVHWAGRPTLLLLRHLVNTEPDRPLLVVATYRDTDLDRRHPLASMLADFRRLPAVERVAVGGLDGAGVLELLELAAHRPADGPMHDLAQVLTTETEGNPFFLGEILRHLAETGAIHQAGGTWTSDRTIDSLGIPEGIREVIGQRLDRLGDDANAVLTVAALIGRDFSVDVVAQVAGKPVDDALAALERATEARLVDEVGLDRYRFAHALVRAALAGELSTSRRLRLHRRIAEVLEEIRPDDHAALAHHWTEAADAGDVRRAIDHSIAAARAATSQLAWDDARTLYERALGLADDAGLADARRSIRLGMGEVELLDGTGDARGTLREVHTAAREAGDTDQMLEAAALLAWSRLATAFAVDEDTDLLELAEQALEAAGPVRTASRAVLLAMLAGNLQYAGTPERRRALADESLALARDLGDDDLFATVASNYITTMSTPDMLERRLDLAHELEAMQPRLTRPMSRWSALPQQPAWEAGLLDEVDRNMALAEQIVETTPWRWGVWANRSLRAKRDLFAGRLAEADRAAEQALALAIEQGLRAGILVYYGQIAAIRLDQGRAGEVVDLARNALPEAGPALAGLVRAFLAWLLAEDGDGEAGRLLDDESAGRFSAQGPNLTWYAYHQLWSEVAAEFSHESAAETLHERLAPWTDRLVNFISSANGSVARVVGRLECVLGRYDDAEQHLAEALATHQRLGAPLWSARTLADQAELVLRRDGDERRARQLVESATAIAQQHLARGVERYAQRCLARGLGR